jgi:hypothetical protein
MIGRVHPSGLIEPPSLELFAESIMSDGRLGLAVPDVVQEQWEAAKASVIYGFYYYPLYALGCEQSLRVAESAIKLKWSEVFPDRKRPNFKNMIEVLGESRIVDAGDWHLVRRMRNADAHPDSQTRIGLGLVKARLEMASGAINSLWP